MPTYSFKPISIREANGFLQLYHRHNDPVHGGKFAVSVVDSDGQLAAVGITGRPVSRALDDGETLEITRVCVKPGHKDVSSTLYARLKQIGQLFGYKRLITYTLLSESGASLRAVGAQGSAVTKGGGWNRKSRPRRTREIYGERKIRWLL